MHQLKYRGWHCLAGTLAEVLARVALPEDVAGEARFVLAVPTTRRRLRERGYNQAEAIARAFAARTRRTLASGLERAPTKGSQTTLQPLARRANVAGAFSVAPALAARLEGAHPLLVDDVLTTGATALECARVLAQGGARCVSVLTFARALDAPRILAL